jgi:hypothetical protein
MAVCKALYTAKEDLNKEKKKKIKPLYKGPACTPCYKKDNNNKSSARTVSKSAKKRAAIKRAL